MPKTKEQIEAEVRAFYRKLTENPYYDNKAENNNGKIWKNFKVTEAEIRMAINSYNEERTETAQKYVQMREKATYEVDRLCKDYGINPEYGFGRLTNHMLDLSGTTEAEEKNREFLESISTREGLKKYVQEQIELASKLDMSLLENCNAINGAALFLNPETSQIMNSAFIARDFLDAAKSLGVEVPQATKDLLEYNYLLMARPVTQIGFVQRILSNPESACINPNIAVVAEFMNNPDQYELGEENEPFRLIKDDYVQVTETRNFSEIMDSLKVNRLFEQNHVPKSEDLLFEVTSGKIMSFKSEDGKEKKVVFSDGRLGVWDRTIQDTTLENDAGYEAVVNEEARLFALFESEGLVNEGNSPKFKKLAEAAKNLHKEFEKGTRPDEKQKADTISDLINSLKDAARDFCEKTDADKLNDPAFQKQLELSDVILRFTEKEANCRKTHIEKLPQSVFGKKVEELLKKPEYDFDTKSGVDSLRIKNFGLYKNADGIEILEESDYIFTNYDAHKSMRKGDFDRKMKEDPYQLLNSQHAVKEIDIGANEKLFEAAKNCSAVVYPSNGDIVNARMLYVDKEGNPRLSEPLGSMPTLSDTMARMDRAREAHQGFEDFPKMPDLGIHPTEEEKRLFNERTALRQEKAMAEFVKDCARCFPDAEEPKLLVSNALNYSAARQNFSFSGYGTVYLTEEQEQNPDARREAVDAQAKAVGRELAQRQLESELILESKKHPEYYQTEALSRERGKIHRAGAVLKYEAEPEKTDENSAIFDPHNIEATGAVEGFLKQKGLQLSDAQFFDVGAKELGKGPNARPWDKYEAAGGLIKEEKPVYIKATNNEKLQKISLVDGELKLAEAGAEFYAQGDAEKRRADFQNIENLYNRMIETGTTRRDSEEYRGMVAATKAALEIARACNTNEATPQAIIARERLETAKAKMATAADKYYMAKIDGSMNSRRTSRFAVSMFARHIADQNFSELSQNPDNLMKEAVATKLVRAEAQNKIKKNAPGAEEAGRLLNDRNALKTKAAEMENSHDFKSLVSGNKDINKLFANDPDKLVKKYNEKAPVK